MFTTKKKKKRRRVTIGTGQFVIPTHCGGDIVTLLWFCVCDFVCPSVSGPCEQDRDYTVVVFFVKLGRRVHYDNRMNPIDF